MARIVVAAGLAALCAGAAGIALSGWGERPGTPLTPAARIRAPRGAAVAAPAAAAAAPVAKPVSLIIPAIGVRTPLIQLGVTSAGSLRVPASTTVAGWYDRSPRPGGIGSSIIAGHVDSRTGPGVFFRLRLLRRGDKVYVRRADGTLAMFLVTSLRRYPKDQFPTAAVYGPAPGAQLRLITCGGIFNQAAGTYLANIVVYAALVS